MCVCCNQNKSIHVLINIVYLNVQQCLQHICNVRISFFTKTEYWDFTGFWALHTRMEPDCWGGGGVEREEGCQMKRKLATEQVIKEPIAFRIWRSLCFVKDFCFWIDRNMLTILMSNWVDCLITNTLSWNFQPNQITR